MNTVKKTVDNNLCTSCGICKSVCPKKCIEYVRKDGLYQPTINNKECISCEICYELCPGKGCDYVNLYDKLNINNPENIYLGHIASSCIAQAKDTEILNNSISGGIVTQLVAYLLDSDKYSCAFLVDTFNYSDQVKSIRYTKEDDLELTAKSRYIPVSHSNAIEYILRNRNEKVILVGTSCFVEGVIEVISKYKLDRDNYFIIGLFCDKTMNYNVYNYFEDMSKDRKIEKLYFRAKEAGQWPGNVRIIYENEKIKDYPASKRMEVKDYFCLERCLYCIDKLNQFADISVGDNYTGEHETKCGSSTVLIRTNKGSLIWNECESMFYINDISIEKIINSQHIKSRVQNYQQSLEKSKKIGYEINTIPYSIEKNLYDYKLYLKRMKKLSIGSDYLKNRNKLRVRISTISKIKKFISLIR